MNLEPAAQALVECGYGVNHYDNISGSITITRKGPHHARIPTDIVLETVDPINNEAQLFALAYWFLFPDKTLTLTGDGHFDVKEQLQNFVEENLK